MTTRVRQATACLVVLAALAAGCGGDDDDAGTGSDGGTTTTEGGSDGERSAADLAADRAAAEKMLPTVKDLPAGWTAQPAEDEDGGSPSDEELNAQLAECMNVDPDTFSGEGDATAESPSFANADEQEAQVEVAFTASEEDASRTLDVMQRPEAERCLSQVFKDLLAKELQGEDLPPGVEVGEPTVEAVEFGDLGDDAAAFEVTVPITGPGTDIDLYVDAAFVRVGRIGITGTFMGAGQAVDIEVAQRLIQSVIDRAPADA